MSREQAVGLLEEVDCDLEAAAVVHFRDALALASDFFGVPLYHNSESSFAPERERKQPTGAKRSSATKIDSIEKTKTQKGGSVLRTAPSFSSSKVTKLEKQQEGLRRDARREIKQRMFFATAANNHHSLGLTAQQLLGLC